jgi:hypothetical protein
MGSAIDLPKFSMSSERIASLYVIKTKAFNKVDAITWDSFESTSAETLCSIVRNLFFRASTSFLVGDTSSGRQQLIPERDNCFHSFKEGLHTAKNERVK